MPDHKCTKEVEITRILMLTEQHTDALRSINRALSGNGRAGLVVEVDRNTQFRKAATWLVCAAGVQVLSSIGVVIAAVLKMTGNE